MSLSKQLWLTILFLLSLAFVGRKRMVSHNCLLRDMV